MPQQTTALAARFVQALCLALIFVPFPARAADITMLFGGGYPPFYEHGSEEGLQTFENGLFIEFLDAFEAAHPEFTIAKIRVPRKRIDQMLREGKAQAFSLNSPLFVKEQDEGLFAFSEPLFRSCDHVATRAGNSFEYTGPESLIGYHLGIVHGNGYGVLDPLIQSGTIETSRPYGEQPLVKMLLRGHVDLAVLNQHTGRTAMDRLGVSPERIRFLEPPVYCFDLCVQVRRENSEFLAALNDFIAASRSGGLLEKLERKWLTGP